MSRISETFQRLRRADSTALMPYLTMGYPARDSALSLVPALVDAGADLIELGVPFSDPLADGPTIQAASQRALQNGMTLALCLEQAEDLRTKGVTVPFVLMGYYNPIFQFGLERFASRAAEAGIDGLIVPDLPPEEAELAQSLFRKQELDLVFLLAPTSNAGRRALVTQCSAGFVYMVSVVGVTGARDRIAGNLVDFVHDVRALTDKPLAVGFGISTPEQAADVARIADGVIVGSALIKRLADAADPALAAGEFVGLLKAAMDRVTSVTSP
ncbi:MAG: tryptophan synthase subunit alpha [Anaerolineae bacterium]